MDFKTLIVKNLPKSYKSCAEYFNKNYNSIAARSYGRGRAVVRFENESIAREALQRLHQSKLENNTLSVEFLGNRKLLKPPAQLEKNNIEQDDTNHIPKVSEFVKDLYATSVPFGFDHPPPPHLKYCYPKINRDILDSISIALMSNTKFYTQVLHLMNRMNLDPPFLERKTPFIPPGEKINVYTQTAFEHITLLASDESELETSGGEEKHVNSGIKRKESNQKTEQVKKKARKMLTLQKHKKQITVCGTSSVSSQHVENVFEQKEKVNVKTRFSLNLAGVKLPEKDPETNVQVIEEYSEKPQELQMKTDIKELQLIDLRENRIPENQLKELPVFKNYQKGDRTNKLYIKNLNKDVTGEDLRNIFRLFTNNLDDELEIKVMQHGRMKGQAFISFVRVTDKDLDIVENALAESNGYILKNKPIVVCFGKK